MKLLTWLLRLFLFFVLLAFALNNTKPITVNWFFGHSWTTPLNFLVLVVFAAGAVLGMLAMVPAWWRQRAEAKRQQSARDAQLSTLNEIPQGVRDGL